MTEVGDPPGPALVKFVQRIGERALLPVEDSDPAFSLKLAPNETKIGLLPDIENISGTNVVVEKGAVEVSVFVRDHAP